MREIEKLLDVMRKLRDKETGCEWDVQQDFSSIAPYTVEEAYEVADAIQRNNMDDLRDELGDLLLQVVFHAQMAAEGDIFDFDDVARGIAEKMIRRHPHVFGSNDQIAAGKKAGSWEQIKEVERSGSGDPSALAGVTKALPALKRAQKLGQRASRVGFDWTDRRGVRAKIHEELEELEEAVGLREKPSIDEEFGDLLFAVVNLARHLDVDPEKALTNANYKFERRFRAMECDIESSGRQVKDFNVEMLDQFWRKAKKRVG
ncbi:MAG: nucleoside triphosphate pyrophosphohydrolase [Gammaproteobacteria bacterium]|nr:nucleoside triphosphate pyrophosphohydrolase [Gammaproteobacteria bacterium]